LKFSELSLQNIT